MTTQNRHRSSSSPHPATITNTTNSNIIINNNNFVIIISKKIDKSILSFSTINALLVLASSLSFQSWWNYNVQNQKYIRQKLRENKRWQEGFWALEQKQKKNEYNYEAFQIQYALLQTLSIFTPFTVQEFILLAKGDNCVWNWLFYQIMSDVALLKGNNSCCHVPLKI